MIRHADTHDADAIRAIYNYYVTDTVVTFEEEPVSRGEMASRIEKVTERFPWLVYEEAGRILGYAYAKRWLTRASYRHTAESTVYLAPDATGKGIGSALYTELFAVLCGAGELHAVIAGIALPNPASVALHEKFGFRRAGLFREVGYKFNTWIDVGFWQRAVRAR
ncbi:MAG TPA: N-acetyltransferase family protein [Spirochaetia bacterium]|nr:N-acetyltransferase family protein [Spirochaetia bacterium]